MSGRLNHCRLAAGMQGQDTFGCLHPIMGPTSSMDRCRSCNAKQENTPGGIAISGSQCSVWVPQSKERNRQHRTCIPCRGAHRSPPKTSMQFVWPYWHGGAMGDELRWSVRSVERHFLGRAHITIVGDRPPWFNGHVIRKNRVPANRQHRPYRDMLGKVFFMATQPDIQPDFVWMMDDVYFLKDFTFEDIAVPRATPWRPSTANGWQKRKSLTMRALLSRNMSTWDYATHLPHATVKTQLRQTFEDFNLHKHTMLWEVLYGNTWHGTPMAVRPFFCRFTRPLSEPEIVAATERCTVMNHVESAWNRPMRRFLMSRFPEPSSVEKPDSVGPYRRAIRFKRVKQKPPAAEIIVLHEETPE